MPKPAKLEEHIRTWLAEQGDPGVVAYARCRLYAASMTAPDSSTQMSSASADPRAAAAILGRDLDEQSLVLGYTHAFIVTASTFRVCRLTGFKERVKDVVVEAPFASTTLRYVDTRQRNGHTVRYLMVDLGDGRWVIDSLGYLKGDGSRTRFADSCDAFVAAFGDRAERVAAD